MSTFNIANPIKIVNPNANLDSRYGPWISVADANSNIAQGLRQLGLTVGVSSVATGVIEYWYKNGIQNTDLVVKTTGGGGGTGDLSLSGNWNSSYATWNSLSAGLVDARTFENTNSSTFIQVRTEVLSQSANWNSVYSLVNQNSSTWTTGNVVTSFSLSSNNAYIIDVSKGNTFFQSVVRPEIYSYSNFTTGKTIVFFLSGGVNIFATGNDLLHQFPPNTFFNGVGESNYVLTITGKVTKITLINVNNKYYGSTELFDLNYPNQTISFSNLGLLLDGLMGYILDEDGDKLLQDNTPISPLP